LPNRVDNNLNEPPEVLVYCMLPLIVLKLRRLWVRLALLVGLFSVYVPIITYAALSRAEGLQEGFVSSFLTLPAAGSYFFIAGVLLPMLVEHLNFLPISPLQPYIGLSLFLVSTPFFLLNPGLSFLHYLELGQQRKGLWGDNG